MKQLTLQFNFNLSDKLSPTLNKLKKSFGILTDKTEIYKQALKENREQLKKVEAYQKQEKELTTLAQKMENSRQSVRRLKDELKNAKATGTTKEIKKLEKEMERAREKSEKLYRAHKKQKTALKENSKTLKDAGLNTKQLKAETERLTSAIEKNEKAMDKVARKARLFNKMEKIGGAFSKLQEQSFFAGNASRAVLSGLKTGANGVGGIFSTAMEFEKMQTVLETLEGSSEKAKKSMSWVSDFATKTPFELDQVSEAFVKLKSYGLDPTNGLLQTLGDTSSAMGKDLMQAVEAIADAVTGENERLKEFGIKASVSGDDITYSYTDKAGKQQTALVDKNNRKEIEQTLSAIFNEKYGGAMIKQSKTLGGIISNLKDQWGRFQLMIAESGAFEALKEKMLNILQTLNKMAENGELKKWAEDIGQAIKSLIISFYEIGKSFAGVARSFANFTGENAGFVAFVIKWVAIFATLGAVLSPLIGIIGALGVALGFLAANPAFIAIFAAIGALIAIGWVLYKNWDTIINGIATLLGFLFDLLVTIGKVILNYTLLPFKLLLAGIKVVFKTLKAILTGNFSALGDIWWEFLASIGNAFYSIVEPIFQFLSDKFGWIVDKFKGLKEWLGWGETKSDHADIRDNGFSKISQLKTPTEQNETLNNKYVYRPITAQKKTVEIKHKLDVNVKGDNVDKQAVTQAVTKSVNFNNMQQAYAVAYAPNNAIYDN